MLFGVFDHLHPGHEYFLREAAGQCQKLIVVVTHDTLVRELKDHSPKQSARERMRGVKESMPEAKVVMGDKHLGSWEILKKYKPDIVFLGYDQENIVSELKKMKIQYEFINAHHPKKFKSSLLNKK